MATSSGILESLIAEDFEIVGTGRWLKTREHSSLVIDTEKQIFFWNSKGIVGTPYVWLTEVKGFSPENAWKILRTFENYSEDFIHTVKGRNNEDVIVYPNLVEIFWTNGQDNDREYWYKRTITDETIDRFRLGYYNGWYTIPIYQDGLFKNFQIRRDTPTKQIRSWYRGVGPLLFNSDILRVTDTIYLTEGPTDAIVLNQNGLLAMSTNAGSEGWQDSWFKYFIHQRHINVIYDNDSAGVFGAKRVAEKLGAYRVKIFTFEGYSEKYDAGDFFRDGGTAEELENLVLENGKFAFEFPQEKRKWTQT